MTAYQVYEQSVKALSVPEKLALARLIIDEVVPNPALKPSVEPLELTATNPSQFGCGRHLLSGAGIDVNELLAVSIDGVFSE